MSPIVRISDELGMFEIGPLDSCHRVGLDIPWMNYHIPFLVPFPLRIWRLMLL